MTRPFYDTLECPLGREPLMIKMACHLTHRAAKPSEMDEWHCFLTTDYPGDMSLIFKMGVGHRRQRFTERRVKHPMTVDDWNTSRPTPPSILSVLTTIGMDYITADDMPRDEPEACDWLATEFGAGAKAGDALRNVRSLNRQADDLRNLLRHTGIDPRHFADWAAALEQ